MISFILLTILNCICGFDIDLGGDFTPPPKDDLVGDTVAYLKESHEVKSYSFDGMYDTYPITDTPYTYGYNINMVCKIINSRGTYYAGLEDAYTFQKVPMTYIDGINANFSKILSCFNYHGYSYIIYQINDGQNITSIIRGRTTQRFKFPYNIEKFLYDHFNSKLYALVEGNELFLINMGEIESFWTESNYAQKLLEKYRDASFKNFFTLTDNLSWYFIKDIFVFNDTIYFIEQEYFEDKRILNLMKKSINGTIVHVRDLGSVEKFTFIPFSQISKYYSGNNNHVKLSLNSLAPSIMISLPSTSLKSNIENMSPVWLLFLYLMDAIFVIILVYIFKYIYSLSRKKIDRIKHNSKNEIDTELQFIDADKEFSPYQPVIISN